MGNYALKITQCKTAGELYEEGYSIRQVADYFGVSHTAVKSALALFGIKHREKITARKARKSWLPIVPKGINQQQKDTNYEQTFS